MVDPTLGCGSLQQVHSFVNMSNNQHSPSAEIVQKVCDAPTIFQWLPTAMDPSAFIHQFTSVIFVWSKDGGWYRCLGSRRCVGSPTAIFLHNFNKLYCKYINNLVYYYNLCLWHVSTPNPRHITIKWVRESVITGALQVGLNYLFDI